MKIKPSFWKLLIVIPFVLFFGAIDYLLIKGHFSSNVHPVFSILTILISLLVALIGYEIPKWIYYLIMNKSIIELNEVYLIEHFHHNVKIPLNNISLIQLKDVHNGLTAPIEMRLNLKIKEATIGKRFNIPSFRSSPSQLILSPTTLGIFSNKKITELCQEMKIHTPSIRIKKLDLLDKWEE